MLESAMPSRPVFLPGLPADLISAAYEAAPGNEIASGKMASPESSSALVANAFGYFLGRPQLLPALPGTGAAGWPASFLALEAIVRFPWAGGRHPCLDVLLATGAALIGVESKRYEPWRAHGAPSLSEAYGRPVWGERMAPYERVREQLATGQLHFQRLDAAQLVKHAFGLRTVVQPGGAHEGKVPVLFYLYAEPSGWPTGPAIAGEMIAMHREEVARFTALVADAEVAFAACTYAELLASWGASTDSGVRGHAAAVAACFDLNGSQLVK